VDRKLITIGYSSLSNRVQKIALPIQRDEVEILVAVQGEYVNPIEREDVRMIYLDGFGAAKSRNVILSEASGEILFFGDDDMHWDESGLTRTIEYLQMNENVDLVLCQSENEFGQLRKRYFQRKTKLSKYNSAKAATYEMAIRLASFQKKNITFHESFGAGTKNFLGDEFIFISEASESDLTCEFLPWTIAVHPGPSSGTVYGTIDDTEARASAIQQVFGRLSLFARLGFILRNPFRFKSFLLIIRFVFRWFPKTDDKNYQ
tara:strand:- start:1796 stop:2578 length:783 start_codon:yes stop_codon:yes gene_type:complete